MEEIIYQLIIPSINTKHIHMLKYQLVSVLLKLQLTSSNSLASSVLKISHKVPLMYQWNLITVASDFPIAKCIASFRRFPTISPFQSSDISQALPKVVKLILMAMKFLPCGE